MDKSKGIILGAGISGLGAFYADCSLDIFEAEECAGGLCGGFEIESFHFDKAVHLSFSKEDVVKKLFAQTEYFVHYPIPISWYHERWLKHPAQNNLYPLSPDEKVQAISGFINRNVDNERKNFKDWSRSRYGEYLWEHLFEPYNKKYWCVDLGELDICWIGNRIYRPSLEEVLYGSYTNETPNTYYVQEMRYPEKGGYYSFIRDIVEDAEKKRKLHYGRKATKIDLLKREVRFQNDEIYQYDRLYSSIPLPEMVQIVEGMNEEFTDLEKETEHTSVVLVSFGLLHSKFRQMWFYIYDSDIMAARAHMPSMKACSNVPNGYESIQFEIYFNSKNDAPDREDAIKNCVYALNKIGICEEREILFSDYRILPYGNVIFKNSTLEKTKQAVQWLKEKGVSMIGRFGRWEYLWSDQAFLSGYNAAKEID